MIIKKDGVMIDDRIHLPTRVGSETLAAVIAIMIVSGVAVAIIRAIQTMNIVVPLTPILIAILLRSVIVHDPARSPSIPLLAKIGINFPTLAILLCVPFSSLLKFRVIIKFIRNVKGMVIDFLDLAFLKKKLLGIALEFFVSEIFFFF